MRVTVREGEARCENKRMEKKEPICIILIRAGIIFFFLDLSYSAQPATVHSHR